MLGGSPRPVGQLSFALDRVISGEGARGFHRTNVAIHVLAGLALFALLRSTFRRPAVAERLGEAGDTAAFVAALLWLLHPLHTSAVSLVVHRYESLMGLFFFASLALLAVAAESTRPAPWLALSAVLSLAGMGTKEPMAAFPLVALLWDRTLWGGSLREALVRRWGYYLALAGGWGLLVLLRFTAPGIASAGFGFEGLGPFDYLRSEAGVLLHYLRLVALPVGLTVDYYDWPVAHSVGQWLPQGLVVLALAAVGGWAVVRRRPEGIAAAAVFLVLAPTSTVIPLFGELAAERRMYVPLAAILALVVPAILLATRRLPESVVGVALLAAAVALGAGTFVRNRVFASAVSLWSDAVAKRPASARARNNLGTALDAVGEAEKAEASWREALRIDPRYAEARGNLAGLLFRSRRLDEADAELRAASALDPQSAPLRHNLGLVAESRGRTAEAAAFYREAVRLDPENVGNLNDLAWLLATTPDPAVRSPAEAIGLARRAVDLAWSPRGALRHPGCRGGGRGALRRGGA